MKNFALLFFLLLTPPALSQGYFATEYSARVVGPEMVAAVQGLASEAGWYQYGGQIVRDAQGEVIGRLHWIPVSEWYRHRPHYVQGGMGGRRKVGEKKYKHRAAEIQTIVELWSAGEILTHNQEELIIFLVDWANQTLQVSCWEAVGATDSPVPF